MTNFKAVKCTLFSAFLKQCSVETFLLGGGGWGGWAVASLPAMHALYDNWSNEKYGLTEMFGFFHNFLLSFQGKYYVKAEFVDAYDRPQGCFEVHLELSTFTSRKNSYRGVGFQLNCEATSLQLALSSSTLYSY